MLRVIYPAYQIIRQYDSVHSFYEDAWIFNKLLSNSTHIALQIIPLACDTLNKNICKQIHSLIKYSNMFSEIIFDSINNFNNLLDNLSDVIQNSNIKIVYFSKCIFKSMDEKNIKNIMTHNKNIVIHQCKFLGSNWEESPEYEQKITNMMLNKY